MGSFAVPIEFLFNGVHDREGNLLAGGRVHTFAAGTNLAKETYLDREKTLPAPNPIILDGEGKANIYADGVYKFVVEGADGETIRIIDDLNYEIASTDTSFNQNVEISSLLNPQLRISRSDKSGTVEVTLDGAMQIRSDCHLDLIAGSGGSVRLQSGSAVAPLGVQSNNTIDAPSGLATPLTLVSKNTGGTSTINVDSSNRLGIPHAQISTADISSLNVSNGITVIGGPSAIVGPFDLRFANAYFETFSLSDFLTLSSGWSYITSGKCMIIGSRTGPNGGILFLNGVIQAGSGTTVGTFPPGYLSTPSTVFVPVYSSPMNKIAALAFVNVASTLVASDFINGAIAPGDTIHFQNLALPLHNS